MLLASDIIERVTDYLGGDAGGDKVLRVARRALQDALAEFPGLHKWSYYFANGRVNLVEPYSTGTVSYNASTRVLTLTGGTWPSWSAYGVVRVGDVVAEVTTRDSDTAITLDEVVTFPDTLTDETFVIYRDRYDMPADFLNTDDGLLDSSAPYKLRAVLARDWLQAVRGLDWTGDPAYYCFVPSETAGRLAMRMFPYPDRSQTMDFLYQRRMRAVLYDGWSVGEHQGQLDTLFGTGTGSTVAVSSTTVTGTGTAFRDDMVGAYIRLSRDQSRPTGRGGRNPYAFEARITARASATSITIDQAPSESFSGVAWTVADPIDLEERTMGVAFAWQCKMHAAASERVRDADSIAATRSVLEAASRHLQAAKEMDSRSTANQRALDGRVWRPTRWRPLGEDQE